MAISLEGVSNQELVGRLKQFVAKEQKLTHRIVLHLAELDRRRLYAELGYTSLFDYCTRGLGYPAASAQRRIKAARAIIQVPEVYDCLENGTLSLGVIETVADALTVSNARELIKEVCGKSRDEARRVVATYHPIDAGKLRDRIEPIVVRRIADEDSKYFRAEVQNEVGNTLEESFRISFTANPELKEKLDRARELLFGVFGPSELGPILDRVLEDYLSRHAPEAKAQRRVEREERRAARKAERILRAHDGIQQAGAAIVKAMPTKDRDPAQSRYISDALRGEVLKRDGHCCTFVADDGTKCCARTGLEIDHIMPFAHGRLTEPGNLRTVCKAHNLMFARKVFGDAHIESIIERRKPGRDGRPTVFVPRWDVLDPAEQLLFG